VLSHQMTAVLALLGGDGAGDRGAGLFPAAATAAATALGVDGICAGVGTGPEGVVLAWGREKTSVALEEAEFTLGQGPSTEAIDAGAPVLVPDLSQAAARWPAFTPAAMDLGVQAVFALPLRIGAISVGVLLAHRDTPGPLQAGQLADALALADAVTVLLLHRAPAEPGRTVAEWSQPRPGWASPATHRPEVHQATGMISVQLGVSLAEALVRLRAHAYANDQPLSEVAANVVARRLRLEDSTP
jgi:ANTAR domain